MSDKEMLKESTESSPAVTYKAKVEQPDEAKKVSVFLYKEGNWLDIPVKEDFTAEQACIFVARSLKFRPVSIHLFGLRIRKSDNIWLPLCFKFNPKSFNYQLEFRLRFKVPVLTNLSRLDDNAFDYIFHQIRFDFLHGGVPEVSLDQRKSEALGLCVTDMLRCIQEHGTSREQIENNYKQFIPKTIYRQHLFFLKKRIQDYLSKLLSQSKQKNVKFIKEQYISQMEELTSRYFTEEFSAMAFKNENYPATIRVNPYLREFSGISMSYAGKQNWESICTIEDLCFVSLRSETMVEISRKNGIPIKLTFKTSKHAQSFVSLLDGYYRLSEKWTFNLCKELTTPSLVHLRNIKCHGPVGQKFAYQKLSLHPSVSAGSFLLRQSSDAFDEYCIDYILTDRNRPNTKIIKKENDMLFIESVSERFESMGDLISHFGKINGEKHTNDYLFFKECLPPSDYDRSPLLLCRKEGLDSEKVHIHQGESLAKGAFGPVCISARNLKVFRGKSNEQLGKTCVVMRALWKSSESTNGTEVALKFLKQPYDKDPKYLKEFLEMADRCVPWQCESLVSMRGIVLGSPQALVMEWMPLGPLDLFLQHHSLNMEVVELIEGASQLAKALWFLEDHAIVHSNIRCHNILVSEHTDSTFTVKLADPSISQSTDNDIHWMPPEFFEIPSLCKTCGTADVWSFGTTLWEIFSMGKKPSDTESTSTPIPVSTYKSRYLSGWRLPRPDNCPYEMFKIMNECWSKIPESRKQPQAAVRDIHQILYQLIGTKRIHAYAQVTPNCSESSFSDGNSGFDPSEDANWTTFGSDMHDFVGHDSDGTLSTFLNNMSLNSSTHSNSTQCTWIQQSGLMNGMSSPDLISNFGGLYNNLAVENMYSLKSYQDIYVFGKDELTLGRMIGQGFYGAVFVGQIVRKDGSSTSVAVKMMKEKEYIPEKEQQDFQREFQILKNLCHPNIVELKGIVNDPGFLLIMEYLPLGSLLDYFKMNFTRPNVKQLTKFAKDVAEGMEYLSMNNIVHRDLAARNILVANDDLAKISDFGLARIMGTDNCYTFRTDRRLPIKWYPPESLQYGKFSEQSDVWSYGTTLYEIYSYGQEPNLPGASVSDVEAEEIVSLLVKGVRLPCPETCPKSVYTTLMLQCWQLNPSHRPTFTKLLGDIMDVESLL